MEDEPNSFGGRASQAEVKQMRLDNPSGWLELSMYESLSLMVDAIVDAPPEYTFTNPELASRAGVSDESVRNHIETLEELGVVTYSDEDSRYQVNENSRVLREVFALNDSVNAVRSGASPSVKSTTERLTETLTRAFENRDIPIEEEDTSDQDSPPIDTKDLRTGPLTA